MRRHPKNRIVAGERKCSHNDSFDRNGLISSVEPHWSTFRSGSYLGISLVAQTSSGHWYKLWPGAPFLAFFARSGVQCDKNDYRGILAGLEGVSGKKAVDSETMTVKN
jgi:hypothetical protein